MPDITVSLIDGLPAGLLNIFTISNISDTFLLILNQQEIQSDQNLNSISNLLIDPVTLEGFNILRRPALSADILTPASFTSNTSRHNWANYTCGKQEVRNSILKHSSDIPITHNVFSRPAFKSFIS